jgi:hypothetical protein
MNPPSATVLPRRSRSWAERARPLTAQVGGMRCHGAGSASKARPARRKNLEPDTLDFFPLQPVEIPQNRQRNLWKSLGRSSLDLEKLAKKPAILPPLPPLPLPARRRRPPLQFTVCARENQIDTFEGDSRGPIAPRTPRRSAPSPRPGPPPRQARASATRS